VNFNPFNSIIFAGIIQGIIFCAIVGLNTRYRNKIVYYLLSLIVTYLLYSIQYYLHDIKLFSSSKMFYDTLYVNWTLAMAPLGLWYGMSIMYPDKKITVMQKLHILPFLLGLIVIVYYKIAMQFYHDSLFLERVLKFIVVQADIFAIMHNMCILGILINHCVKLQKFDPYIKRWVSTNLIIYGVIIILWIVMAVAHGYFTTDGEYYPLWISVSFMIYWFGYMGIMRYGVQMDRIHIRQKINKRSQKKKQKKEAVLQQFEQLFYEDKYYLNPLISQEEVAQCLGVSSSYLSTLLSNELNTSFNTYINKLRTQEVIEMISNPNFQQYNLLSIGLEAGFNSKTSFYTAFKKNTGFSPAQFKKRTV
jgi:AraC-like DNA-binding protein